MDRSPSPEGSEFAGNAFDLLADRPDVCPPASDSDYQLPGDVASQQLSSDQPCNLGVVSQPVSPASARVQGSNFNAGPKRGVPNAQEAPLGTSPSARGGSFDSSDYRNLLRFSHGSLRDELPKLPWDEGFWGDFFQPASSLESHLALPKFARFTPPVEFLKEASENCSQSESKRARKVVKVTFERVVLNRTTISWRDQREADHCRALVKWCRIFESWDVEVTAVSQQLREAASPEACQEMLGDYLSRKAPSTCLKRANSMLRLCKYVSSNGHTMPVPEPMLYGTLRSCKSGGASLSELRGIMESITFVHYTFDVACLLTCVKSKRCWGLSSAKQATLADKADPFTVEDMLELHRILNDGDDLWDRLMSGVSLACIYSRCRWSDIQHIDSMTLEFDDQGFAEFGSALIGVHKTMNFSSKLPKCMEIIAVGRGLDGSDWLSTFMSAGAWLRELLPGRAGLRTTSHSLKATLLSFAAKRGFAHLDRLLAGMLSEIRSGRFCPDSGRAARFPGRTNEELIGTELPTGAGVTRDVGVDVPIPDDVKSQRTLSSSKPDSAPARCEEVRSAGDSGSGNISSFSQWDIIPAASVPLTARDEPLSPGGLDMSTDDHASDKSGSTEPPSPDFPDGVPDLLESGEPDELQGPVQVPQDISEVDPDGGVSSSGDTSSDSSSSESSQEEEPRPRLMPPPIAPAGTFFVQHRKLRCKEITGDDELLILLQAAGVRTHSGLAFSCGTPKTQPTDVEFKAFAESVVGSPASIGRVSELKRLHFESSTLVIAQLRTLVEGDSSDSGKKLPAAEKAACLADAKRRLAGLVIEDEMEPSHALIDAVAHMGESNSIVWIPPSKCTKRDSELKLGLRDQQKYLTVQEQAVTLAPAPDKLTAEHGTPLEVQWCLQRRGLAFFMCGFLEWETHEKWVASLLRCLSADVPPGYSPISMQQILRADSELFLHLAREVKRVKPDSAGVMEMDVLMNRLKAPVKAGNLPEELKLCPYQTDAAGHRATADMACSTFTFSFSRVPETSAGSALSHPGEVLAARLLASGSGTSDQLLELAKLLPSETPTKSDGSVPVGRAFTTGTYYHCGTVGLRHNVRGFPFTSCLLASLARLHFPDLHFTSVGIFLDVKTRRHRDLRNLPGSLNGVAPLCQFRGGEVRVHHAAGPEDLPVSAGPISFDAKIEHETLPWSSGHRLVLVVFSTYGISKLSISDLNTLQNLGFVIPGFPAVDSASPASVTSQGHTTSAASNDVSGVVLDVFAADAAFCKAAHKAGFHALAFDLKPQRAQFPIQALDITKDDERTVIMDVISEHASTLAMVQFTIPCLSSFFTDVSGSWDFALRLVTSVFIVCQLCHSLGVPFAILHPATSRFWHTPACTTFLDSVGGHWCTFDQCMHGGAQDRRAFWWSSTDVFTRLQATCSKDHKHGAQPKSASQWPHLLWDRAVELLCQRAGFAAYNHTLFGPPGKALRPAMNKQSRKARPLVSEFCAYDAWAALEVIWVGIPREPEDFLQRAVAAGHPKALLDVETDPQMTMLIDNLLGSGVSQPGKGLDEVRRWEEVHAELESSQASCKKTWPDHVSQVLADKPTLLMEHLLAEYDFPDRLLVKHMTQGFKLSGWVCRSRNAATLKKLEKQASDEVTKRAWSETLEEVAKGWIEEDEDPDLSATLVAKRFGLAQGLKTRVIDDCKACAFNLLTGIPEKYRLQGVEYLAAFLLRAMLDPRSRGARVSGRTLDLTSAYKQYAVNSLDRDTLRIGVKDTDTGRVRTYKVNSLPFGATASVSSFLRCAAATWFLGSHALGIPWTSYFDDFPLFSLDENCEVTDHVATSFLDLLRIYFAKEGRKATVFGKSFKALGLVIDLSHFGEGYVTIGHTPERGEELRSTIANILEADRLSHAEAESLRGRLHWYTSFLFGRRSAQALNVLSDWVNRGTSKCTLSDDLRDSLKLLRDVSLHSEPLKISGDLRRSFLVFTDGSLEGDFACVGGILHDSHGTPMAFFSITLDATAVERLYAHSAHPIYEIELLAMWTALKLWDSHIRDSYSVFYLDNEAARGALISGRSSTLTGSAILESFMSLEDASLCRPWFGRVPTHSNCADEPSRGSFQHLVRQGVRRDSLCDVWPF
ncbi:unnamed protein product [Symbiodinium sp. CCMP2456]|nr:unnamed protein product [Symbiodinium sp. CCMP2456]